MGTEAQLVWLGEDNCPAAVGCICGRRHLEPGQTSDLAARLGWAAVLGLGCWGFAGTQHRDTAEG